MGNYITPDANIPEIRFPEFDEPWKEIKLKDIASFSKGKGISKNETSETGLPCIRYGELYTKYSENISEIYSKTNLERDSLVLSEKNDILIPCSGETAIDLATASCVRDDNVAIGGDITIIKTNQYAPFITYCLNNKRTEIAKYAQGVSIVHLYAKDFQDMKLMIPQISEQKRIVDFLEKLNKYIDSLEKKHGDLKLFKNHLLNHIIFKDYEEKWDVAILENLSIVKDGTHDSPKYFNEGFPLVTSKNLLDGGLLDLNNVNLISKEDYDKINKRSKVSKGDILFGMIGTIGNPVIVNTDGFAIKNVALIKEKEELNNTFLIHVLNSNIIKKQFYKLNAGGTQKFIALNLIRNLKVPVPSIEEQNQISKSLELFDKKIKFNEKEILYYKKFKKGLLQKMFV